MGKETSDNVSHLAGIILNAKADGNEKPDDFARLLHDAKIVAGSCLSQDETPGPGPITLMRRVNHERTELSDRLKKLTAYLNKGAPGASETQRSLLNAQKFCMSEYLAVLDQRLQDLSLAENSESNHGQ